MSPLSPFWSKLFINYHHPAINYSRLQSLTLPVRKVWLSTQNAAAALPLNPKNRRSLSLGIFVWDFYTTNATSFQVTNPRAPSKIRWFVLLSLCLIQQRIRANRYSEVWGRRWSSEKRRSAEWQDGGRSGEKTERRKKRESNVRRCSTKGIYWRSSACLSRARDRT